MFVVQNAELALKTASGKRNQSTLLLERTSSSMESTLESHREESVSSHLLLLWFITIPIKFHNLRVKIGLKLAYACYKSKFML